MSASRPEEVNPYAPPSTTEATPPGRAKSDDDLRHEYLGAVLLAAGCGVVAAVFFLASTRYPRSNLGAATQLMSRWVAVTLAFTSLLFVAITLRAASVRVWRLLRVIWGLRH